MEKIPYSVILIILALVIIIAVVLILKIIRESSNENAVLLEKACLELMKNSCDESLVVINSKSFEDICKRNSFKLNDCKKFCGC